MLRPSRCNQRSVSWGKLQREWILARKHEIVVGHKKCCWINSADLKLRVVNHRPNSSPETVALPQNVDHILRAHHLGEACSAGLCQLRKSILIASLRWGGHPGWPCQDSVHMRAMVMAFSSRPLITLAVADADEFGALVCHSLLATHVQDPTRYMHLPTGMGVLLSRPTAGDSAAKEQRHAASIERRFPKIENHPLNQLC